MPYRSLNDQAIVDTMGKLARRIEARFEGRGLTKVANELCQFAVDEIGTARRVSRPRILVRMLTYLVIISGIAALGFFVWQYKTAFYTNASFEMFEGAEALINIVLLMAAGIWFLLNLETRMKRHDVLVQINQLRSIAHVIDMHQLSKDPMVDLHANATSEATSEGDLHGYELIRYLDYCADMLAITGKLAAIYLEHTDDAVVIQSVNDFEALTGHLSRKVWQKITVMELHESQLEDGASDSPQEVTLDKVEPLTGMPEILV